MFDRSSEAPPDREDWALRHYANYLTAYSHATIRHWGDRWREPVAQESLRRFAGDPAAKWQDHGDRVLRFLRGGWYTEHLIHSALNAPEVWAFANQWAVVQGYYAVYSAGQAAKIVLTGTEANHHRSFLTEMSGLAARDKFSYPLGVHCVRQDPPSVSGLSHGFSRVKAFTPSRLPSDADCEQYLFSAVTNARWDRIEAVGRDWKKKNRKKRVPNGHHAATDRKQQPTTLFDVLYELRRRANYGDADVFVAAGISQGDPMRLLEGIAFITEFAMLTFECAIAARAGVDVLSRAAADHSTLSHDERLQSRLALLRRLSEESRRLRTTRTMQTTGFVR